VESCLDAVSAVDGPVYLRMLRGAVPRLFPADEPMVVGCARTLAEGREVTVLSTGICTEEAMRASAALAERGVSLRHLHVSTLKPFDDRRVADALRETERGVITFENHSIIGGLGSATAELMAEAGAGIPLVRLGLPDRYAHGASRPYLMRAYGLDATALVRAVEKLLDRALDISEQDLAEVRLDAVHSDAKPEAL
jgi:transketolase